MVNLVWLTKHQKPSIFMMILSFTTYGKKFPTQFLKRLSITEMIFETNQIGFFFIIRQILFVRDKRCLPFYYN